MAEDSGPPACPLMFLIQGLLSEEYICSSGPRRRLPLALRRNFPFPRALSPEALEALLPALPDLYGLPYPHSRPGGHRRPSSVRKHRPDTWCSWLSSRPKGGCHHCLDTSRPKSLLPPSFRGASALRWERNHEKDTVMT